MEWTWIDHLLAAVLGGILPLLGLLNRSRPDAEIQRFDTTQKIALYRGNSAVLAVLATGVVLSTVFAGRPLASLGLAWPWNGLIGLALSVVFLALFALDCRRQLAPGRIESTRLRWQRDTPFMPETRQELAHSLLLVVTASVCEEIVYRGFLIPYVAHWIGHAPVTLAIAVLLPALIFGIGHVYQGWFQAFKIFLFAGLIGAIFVSSGSLLLPIVIHLIVDTVGMLISPRLMRAQPG